MTSALFGSIDSFPQLLAKDNRPIKVWSSNQIICEDPEEMAEEEQPVSPLTPKFPRRKSTSYVVPGLSYDFPQQELSKYDIPQAFWNKFIAALNAALSEYPTWKNPSSVHQKHRLSFSEGDSNVLCLGPHEPSQINQADRVLKWWNNDYFMEKGCQVQLEIKSSQLNFTDSADLKTGPQLTLKSL